MDLWELRCFIESEIVTNINEAEMLPSPCHSPDIWEIKLWLVTLSENNYNIFDVVQPYTNFKMVAALK